MKKDKNKRIINLIKADGDDADLILLEDIEDLEAEIESLSSSLEDGLAKIKDVSGTHYEIVDKIAKNLVRDIKGDKGDTPVKGVDYFDGENYVLTEKDKKEIASKVKIEVPIVEKIIERIEVVKKEVDIEEVSTMVLADVMSQLPEAKETILDTPDQIIDKVNTSTKKIKKEKVEGMEDLEQRITYATALPVTTNFFNGLRAKNMNIVGATATQSGDTVNITVPSGGGSITVTESDGSPSVSSVTTLKFPNGSVTDDGGGVVTMAFAGSGDVVGPASATDNAVARFDATTGKLLQDSAVTISDTGVINSSVLTASEILGTDASKNLVSLAVATYPSLTELSYVKGVTSAIQTQIGTKAPSTAPTFATSITGSYLTASEMLITDASKNIVSAPVATYPSLTELSYVKGVTSAIQTQLGDKAPIASPSFTGTVTTAGNIELGHASDTTLSRSSAGVLAVEGVVIPSISSTSTLTNKRINPRLVTATSYTTDTGTSLDVSTCDQFEITAQAGALLFNAPGGTPLGGQRLTIRIKDSGTARALTWNAVFRAMGVALPSTTVLSKTLYLGFIYNATDTTWDLVASAQQA